MRCGTFERRNASSVSAGSAAINVLGHLETILQGIDSAIALADAGACSPQP
jgi:hypothetical protein